MNRTYQRKQDNSCYIFALQVIVTILTTILLTWIIASYTNTIQHNMGSCEYTSWNLFAQMSGR